MSNQNEVQSWKYNFSTWSEKPNSVAGNYSTSTSPAGWALLFSSSGKWRTTGDKTFSEIPTGKKSLGRAPARQAASSLTQNVGLGRAGQAGTHSWFLSILCLQGQSTPIFQRAPIVFSAPQVPKLMQTGCQDATALFSETHGMVRLKHINFLLWKPTWWVAWEMWLVLSLPAQT